EAGDVADAFEEPGDGDGVGGDRLLAFRLGLDVVADLRVAGVLAGHEDAARWGADGIAGVVLGEAQALGGELVEVGRPDLLLPVAAELGVTEIVGEDVDDVGLLRVAGPARSERDKDDADGKEETCHEAHHSRVSRQYGGHGPALNTKY